MEENLSENILNDAQNVIDNLLPDKSRGNYLKEYNKFMQWKVSEKISENNFSETVMLAYFSCIERKYKSSSLLVIYSMLKTTIEQKNNVNIGYRKLNSWLKKKSIGFVPKKSKVFEAEHINTFLLTAEDDSFLVVKVVLIFGIYGATRADELTKVVTDDVTIHGDVIIVKRPEKKTNVIRSFTIENEHATCVLKYMKLRPSKAITNRFFLNFQMGKCTIQPIGYNKFLKMPQIIATFLGLSDTVAYTGHSFRRTSATLVAHASGERHEGWKSTNVVEGYIDNKRKISSLIGNQIKVETSSTVTSSQSTVINLIKSESGTENIDHSTVDPLQLPVDPLQLPVALKSTNGQAFESSNDHILELVNYDAGEPLSKFKKNNYSFTFNNCTNVTINYH